VSRYRVSDLQLGGDLLGVSGRDEYIFLHKGCEKQWKTYFHKVSYAMF